ncbi:MAG: PAS domain-containing sensor histidine kinase [Oligoflexales bacterium]|nr:PAS domain-containing sensor histidine kinase [Oligoflexales bacterium]
MVTNDCLVDWNIVDEKIWRYEGKNGFLGFSRSDIRTNRRWWIENVHPEDRDTVIASFINTKNDDSSLLWSHEYRFRSNQGPYHIILEKGQLIRDEKGTVTRYVGALRDITDQRELESHLILSRKKAEEASQAKSRFIASVSHELRTPLNAVIGFSDLLQMEGFDSLTEQQSGFVSQISKSARHLLSMVDDLLAISSIEYDKMKLHKTDVDVAEMVSGCIRLHSIAHDIKGTFISQQIEPGLTIYADEKRITQVISNLISNAIKFTPERGMVDILAGQSTQGTTFRVSDNGIGIEEKHLARIFDYFEQVGSDQPVCSSSGLGLGLAISKRLVELHGGKMWVESNPGSGSCFYFSIPNG